MSVSTTSKICTCDWCAKWSPLFTRISEVISDEDKKILEDFLLDNDHRRLDGEVAEAKLDGTWPGWEMFKGFNPNTHAVVPMEDLPPDLRKAINDNLLSLL